MLKYALVCAAVLTLVGVSEACSKRGHRGCRHQQKACAAPVSCQPTYQAAPTVAPTKNPPAGTVLPGPIPGKQPSAPGKTSSEEEDNAGDILVGSSVIVGSPAIATPAFQTPTYNGATIYGTAPASSCGPNGCKSLIFSGRGFFRNR